MSNFKEFDLRLVPLLLGINIRFQTLIQDGGFIRLSKPLLPFGVGNRQLHPKKKTETDFETKLLKVKHMSRPKSCYLALPSSVLK